MAAKRKLQLLVVTGMSGAGKSIVMDVLEDIGYYCIDNLPPQLAGKFVNVCRESERHYNRVAIAMDLRAGDFFTHAQEALQELRQDSGINMKVVFVDANDERLVQRYKETRRRHPLEAQGQGDLHEAMAYERRQLADIKDMADYYIETSMLSVAQLKEQIRETFLNEQGDSLSIKVTSFGFKYGVSTESDLIFDVRCLPNPYYRLDLRPMTGLDEPIQEYVMSFAQSQELLHKLTDLFDFLIPLYIKEGKSSLVISFGCTGGKHRSVTFAQMIGHHLRQQGLHVLIQHRDIRRGR